jgi:hypothetical protein
MRKRDPEVSASRSGVRLDWSDWPLSSRATGRAVPIFRTFLSSAS